MNHLVAPQRIGKTPRMMSLFVALLFGGQTLALDARLAWADEVVPGAVDNKVQQGTAKTPDAVLGQTGEWDEVTVNKEDADGTELFASGRVKSKKDSKTGDVTEYMDDDLHRVARILYKDGTAEKTVEYVGATDKAKTVERTNADGVLTHTYTYTYTKKGSQDYVTIGVKGLTSLQYGFTYARQADGSLKLAGMEFKNSVGTSGIAMPGSSNGGLGLTDWDGAPISGFGLLFAQSAAFFNELRFEFHDDGTVDAFERAYSYNPYQKAAGTFTWNAATGVLSASGALGSSNRASDWSIQLAATQGNMPHRIESVNINTTVPLSGGRQDYAGSVEFDRDGLADLYKEQYWRYSGNTLSYTTSKVQTLGYTTYVFGGKPTVRMTSLDENAVLSNGRLSYVYSKKEWGEIGNQIVMTRIIQDTYGSAWASNLMWQDKAYQYELIDGKAYVKSIAGASSGLDAGGTWMYFSNLSRTDYTNFKVGSEVRSYANFSANEKTFPNGLVKKSEETVDVTYTVAAGKLTAMDTTREAMAEDRMGQTLLSGTQTTSLQEVRYDSRGNALITKNHQTYEQTNYTDLTVSAREYTSVAVGGVVLPEARLAVSGIRTVTDTDGVVKTTQSANYDAILAQSRVQYADVWATLKGAPAPEKKDVHQTDPATGKVIQTTYVNGDIRQFDANGLTTSFYEAASRTTTVYHPGSDKVKSVSTPDGVVKTYDLAGLLVRQDEKNGDYGLFDSAGKKTFFFQASTGNRTEYANTGLVRKIIYGAGYTDLHDASGKAYRREFPNGNHQILGADGQIVLAYDSSTGNIEHYTGGVLSRIDYADGSRKVLGSDGSIIVYYEDGVTVRSVRNADGSYREFSKIKPGQVVTERFALPNPEGAIGYSYDSKNRKIKTVFADESYIITTYKDDSSLPETALNTESFFDKDHKNLRTLVYNSKGTQVRWMVTEEAKTLNCFFDECWKEDMGLAAGWNGTQGPNGTKVAVIEAGTSDSSHAMAVAGIINRITGQTSSSTVFTANDHIKVIDAIKVAASSGFKVINLSLEFMREGVLSWGRALGYDADRAIREFKAMLQSAVDFARSLGAVIVAAAGNQGSDFSLLAELDGVVSVGSTDYLGRRLGDSGYGSGLDFMASGYKVFSEGQLWTGTSFAAPMMSGMIAGLLVVNGQRYTESQILGAMQASTQDLGSSGWDQYTGWGKANGSRAMASLLSGLYQLFLN